MNATLVTETLNNIAELLGTDDKNLVLSVAVNALVTEGLTVKQAIETLFGEGAYDKMAELIYDELAA